MGCRGPSPKRTSPPRFGGRGVKEKSTLGLAMAKVKNNLKLSVLQNELFSLLFRLSGLVCATPRTYSLLVDEY
jgi:hypothetical protein